MNSHRHRENSFRTFQLLNVLEENSDLSQRELATRLGIAVGLVNSYLKHLIAKGFLRIRNYPRNRYAYLLTPKGFAEKSRLAYQHLSYFNSLFTVVRQDYVGLFQSLRDQGHQVVIFCGVDEVAEIAYLAMQEVDLHLHAVIDSCHHGERFFSYVIKPLDSIESCRDAPIVITTRKHPDSLIKSVLQHGVERQRIYTLCRETI